MKCQTCVRARLRHLTWPINLGLIGLCHNKTLALSERYRYTTAHLASRILNLAADIDAHHSLLIFSGIFFVSLFRCDVAIWRWWFLEICHIYRRTSDRYALKVGQIVGLGGVEELSYTSAFLPILAWGLGGSSLVDILSDSLIA